MSLFEQASVSPSRIKMLIYGESGTGKTVTSLQFPSPVVIDVEKGTEYYGEHFKFARLRSVDPDEINEALDELIENPGEYKTCVIDSISVLCDLVVEKQIMRMRVRTGDPNYVLKGPDYSAVKGDIKRIVKKILALDMNVIATAHSKPLYAKGEFMKQIGTIPEVHKDIPYLFDVNLELSKDENGNFKAISVKDRSNRLPAEEFDFSYKTFVDLIGIESLEREASAFEQKRELNARSGRSHVIEIEGQEVFTAGITVDTLLAIKASIKGMKPAAVEHMLNENYAQSSLLDLREDEAQAFLTEVKELN